MWAKLKKWWYWLLGREPEGKSTWVLPEDAGIVLCPICRASYDVRDSIPGTATQATIVCANADCREQMEVYKDDEHGWVRPRVVWREKSFV